MSVMIQRPEAIHERDETAKQASRKHSQASGRVSSDRPPSSFLKEGMAAQLGMPYFEDALPGIVSLLPTLFDHRRDHQFH